MLLHNKHTVLMSPADSRLVDSIKQLGINVVFSECIDSLRANEQYHADMQLLVIDSTAFIPSNCTRLENIAKECFDNVVICEEISDPYPSNVVLNAALVGDKLFCKESALAAEVKEYCSNNNIKVINVNQGYAKCSTLIVSDNAIVTADETICTAAQSRGVKVLKIRPGFIYLQDADYGFIGGCSGKVGECIVFFGDIKKHPDSKKIIEFIANEGVEFTCIADSILNDIGGIVQLK